MRWRTWGSLLSAWLLVSGVVHAQFPQRWKQHDTSRPRPPIVTPGAQTLPVPPPSDALVLFDGKDLSAWRSADAQPPRWIIQDGVMESVPGAGYLYTARAFGDIQLHVEWASPAKPEGTSQGRGNSGVFLMGLFEVQVLDSFNNETYADGQAAAIYGQHPPLANVCRGPGEWQSYDITFRRPRYQPDGSLEKPARISVLHNGVLVQDNVEPWGPTAWLQALPYESNPDRLPLSLQDHGNPVRYRNIWLRELPEQPSAGPPVDSRPVISLSAAEREKYVGSYGKDAQSARRVRVEGGQLQFNASGQWLDMIPYSATDFGLRWTAGLVKFDLDEQGAPTALHFHLGGQEPGSDPKLK